MISDKNDSGRENLNEGYCPSHSEERGYQLPSGIQPPLASSLPNTGTSVTSPINTTNTNTDSKEHYDNE